IVRKIAPFSPTAIAINEVAKARADRDDLKPDGTVDRFHLLPPSSVRRMVPRSPTTIAFIVPGANEAARRWGAGAMLACHSTVNGRSGPLRGAAWAGKRPNAVQITARTILAAGQWTCHVGSPQSKLSN